ncbi:Holliday junction branch migration protein RuvA [Bombella sp. TMW 2.2543]|uniref:Holliday junction branch migration complex subunit RuvA n=1 Tax=Bombella pluederhausensis TaxID=2967336 RepID=A0ABT3WEF1_9PROT|nr:Holliday junction branch migration protein RuvA [Bombella pluederhausensis]MCX5617243.1 Holliday junction branch migration protein RuvA [Bombella pluederhausensis]
MIGQLTGLVSHIEGDHCLIDVNGVGYVVSASSHTLGLLPRPPELARVLVETIVREDAIQLFGFAEADEQAWFRLLTTVQGVGNRVALAILSASRPSLLWQAVHAEDKTAFTQAAGVGPKLATRLLTELKGKVAKMPAPASMSGQNLTAVSGAASKGSTHSTEGLEQDALMALEGLGFRRAESWPIVNRIIGENAGEGLDVIIRLALKELAR